VQFQEWLLDSQLYPGLTLTAARDLYRTLDRLLTAAPPEQVQQVRGQCPGHQGTQACIVSPRLPLKG
jgi:hypothetical protein